MRRFEFTALLPLARESTAESGDGIFGRGSVRHTPDRRAIVGKTGEVTVLAYGRVRLNGAELPATEASVAALGAAWQRHGGDFLDRLDGEFIVVLASARSGAWLAAVDRFSTFRLYYGTAGGQIALGTAPIDIAKALGIVPDLEPKAVLAYAYFHVIPAPLCIVTGVHRLDHGEAIAGDGQGGWKSRRYWSPAFQEDRAFDFAVERERFLGALRSGVRECVEGLDADEVGCFLSGGTDSSTIAGLVTERFGNGARTFSIGFGVNGYDETRYSRIATEHFRTRHTEYYLTPADVEQALPMVAAEYEQPFGNASAAPTHFCAKIAAGAGVRRMLGGDGGDELYGGNERYAKQWLFSVWGEVPATLRAGVFEPLLFGPLGRVHSGVVRKARSYVAQTRVPLPDRLQGNYNLLDRFGRNSVFTDEFLARAAPFEPAAFAREVWDRCHAGSQINRLLAYDFKFTLADSDLPKVTRMCETAGIEVSFPMLTRAVTDHSLALAPDQKLRRTQLRYFFKNALHGFLPEEILRKEKHGFGMPFGDWVIAQPRLQALANDALGGLAQRGYIRADFIGQLRTRMGSGHAGYYGTMVWILAVLELWLREHMADARCA